MPQEPPPVVLSRDQYGEAEVRLLHVGRGQPAPRVTDLNVTVTLAGDMDATYLTGDNSGVLTTDAQKNTVYALARDGGRPVEEFALRLARHFAAIPPRWTGRRCVSRSTAGSGSTPGAPRTRTRSSGWPGPRSPASARTAMAAPRWSPAWTT